jgi:hypothetical protein
MKIRIFIVVTIAFSLLGINSAKAIEIDRTGNCSAGSLWQADLELEFNVYDLGFEIDTKNADENWAFTLRHNGKRVLSETRPSQKEFDDSYAEVEWDVVRPDRKGADTFVFRAINQVTGEVCRATLKS